jgi:hypothetical protein
MFIHLRGPHLTALKTLAKQIGFSLTDYIVYLLRAQWTRAFPQTEYPIK